MMHHGTNPAAEGQHALIYTNIRVPRYYPLLHCPHIRDVHNIYVIMLHYEHLLKYDSKPEQRSALRAHDQCKDNSAYKRQVMLFHS
jgi:hypothetical protein